MTIICILLETKIRYLAISILEVFKRLMINADIGRKTLKKRLITIFVH